MSRIKAFGLGLNYMKRGFHFFFSNRKLWWYAIIPTIINIAVMVLAIWLMIHYFDHLTGWIFGEASPSAAADLGWLAKIWSGFLGTIIWIAKALIFVILLLFLLLAVFIVSMIIAGPFNDALSEKVEVIALGGEEAPFTLSYILKSTKRTIIVELQKALFFLSIPIILLVLNLLPAIGSALYIIIAGIFAAFDIGFNFSDYPMSRKLWSFRDRIKIAWLHKYMFVGFGIVALIPLFPYLFAAPLVVGGTLMFSEFKKDESDSQS